MTKYFFHKRDGSELVEDEEGTDLPDLEAARNEAILAAREMMAEMVLEGKVVDGQQFEITSEDGSIADIVTFKSAIKLA